MGAVSGVLQFWLLAKFALSVSRNKFGKKTALFVVFQFFLPFVVLICCALLLPEHLMWTGIGMAASLVICATIRSVVLFKSSTQ